MRSTIIGIAAILLASACNSGPSSFVRTADEANGRYLQITDRDAGDSVFSEIDFATPEACIAFSRSLQSKREVGMSCVADTKAVQLPYRIEFRKNNGEYVARFGSPADCGSFIRQVADSAKGTRCDYRVYRGMF